MPLCFFLLVLKQANVVVIVTISMCVPDVVKNLNVKVFNLMAITNETRYIEWYETCKCRLDGSVCNNKQRWNDDKFRCKCKELIDKGVYDKGYIWDPSKCECDKLCDIGKCRKKLLHKFIEECTETVEEKKLAKITLSEDENKYNCSSCTLYIALFSILFTVNVGIVTYFIYSHWYLKRCCSC